MDRVTERGRGNNVTKWLSNARSDSQKKTQEYLQLWKMQKKTKGVCSTDKRKCYFLGTMSASVTKWLNNAASVVALSIKEDRYGQRKEEHSTAEEKKKGDFFRQTLAAMWLFWILINSPVMSDGLERGLERVHWNVNPKIVFGASHIFFGPVIHVHLFFSSFVIPCFFPFTILDFFQMLLLFIFSVHFHFSPFCFFRLVICRFFLGAFTSPTFVSTQPTPTSETWKMAFWHIFKFSREIWSSAHFQVCEIVLTGR